MSNSNSWLWPVKYTRNVTQRFTGSYSSGLHSGIDISSSGISGQKVYASKSGTISNVFSGCGNSNALSRKVSCSSATCSCNNLTTISGVKYCNYGLGNAIYIKHGDNSYSQYAHLSSFADGITAGAHVERGQVIGYVGSTGESTAAHLHFSLSTNASASGRYDNNVDVIDYAYDYPDDVPETVTLSFNTDGGSSISNKIYIKGTEIGELPTPTRTGTNSTDGIIMHRARLLFCQHSLSLRIKPYTQSGRNCILCLTI